MARPEMTLALWMAKERGQDCPAGRKDGPGGAAGASLGNDGQSPGMGQPDPKLVMCPHPALRTPQLSWELPRQGLSPGVLPHPYLPRAPGVS